MSVGYMFVLANAMLPRLIPELRRSIPGVDLDFAELSASTREPRLRPQRHRRAVHASDPPSRDSGGPNWRTTVHAGGAKPFAACAPERGANDTTTGPSADRAAAAGAGPRLLRGRGPAAAASDRDADREPGGDGAFGDEPRSRRRRPRDPARLRQLGAPPGIVFRPLRDAPNSIDIAVCWRRDSQSPLIRTFLKCAEKVGGADVTRAARAPRESHGSRAGRRPGGCRSWPAQLAAKDSARRSSSAPISFSAVGLMTSLLVQGEQQRRLKTVAGADGVGDRDLGRG